MNRFRRWLVLTTLCLSGGIIFLLPYLFEVYYIRRSTKKARNRDE